MKCLAAVALLVTLASAPDAQAGPCGCLPEKLKGLLKDEELTSTPAPTVAKPVTNASRGSKTLTVRPTDKRIAKDSFRTQTVARKVEALASMPSDATSFETIFKRTPSKAELAEIERLTLPDSARVADASASFASQIKGSEAGIVAVVGHNSRGHFVFADGTKMTLEEMGTICRDAGKLCVFVSCNSATHVRGKGVFGVQHELTFREALAITADIEKRLPAAVTPDELMTVLPEIVANAERSTHTKFRVEYVAKRVAAGLAITAIAVAASEE